MYSLWDEQTYQPTSSQKNPSRRPFQWWRRWAENGPSWTRRRTSTCAHGRCLETEFQWRTVVMVTLELGTWEDLWSCFFVKLRCFFLLFWGLETPGFFFGWLRPNSVWQVVWCNLVWPPKWIKMGHESGGNGATPVISAEAECSNPYNQQPMSANRKKLSAKGTQNRLRVPETWGIKCRTCFLSDRFLVVRLATEKYMVIDGHSQNR